MVEEKGLHLRQPAGPERGRQDRFMISFLDPRDGIAVAVDRASDGDMDHIHVFQDVTRDGKLDMDDTRLIEREALKLFRQEGLEEGQLKLFGKTGLVDLSAMIVAWEDVGIGLKIFRRMLMPRLGIGLTSHLQAWEPGFG